MEKLKRDFYETDGVSLSQKLLGKRLVHIVDGERLSGTIVETEAYMGSLDKGAHSYRGKTERNKVMFGPSGFAYVYFIYGLYYCFNVVANKKDIPQAVLIRAIEPDEGLGAISLNRYKKSYESLTKKEKLNLTSGPSKLCTALKIDKSLNGCDLLSDILFIEDTNKNDIKIKSAKRIGIDYAEEAKDFLWRFYDEQSPYVSKKVK